MTPSPSGLEGAFEMDALRQRHQASGLWDDRLLDRYVSRRDFVAFIDETHRSSDNGRVGFYGISAVVFHADDLPEIRADLRDIAGGTFWHSKEAIRDRQTAPRIAEMNEYIARRSALPAMVFDVRDYEMPDDPGRDVRDPCLRRALQVLDQEGIGDVVLDDFPAQLAHERRLDQAVLQYAIDRGQVSPDMWMHHGRMSEEHALWTADSVAWSVQRHQFGAKGRDSLHVAPLAGKLREIHAQTGQARILRAPDRVRMVPPAGAEARTPPVHSLLQRVEAARARAAAPPTDAMDGMQKAPPVQGPEGPSRSL